MIRDAIIKFLTSNGYAVADTDPYNMIDLWQSWYAMDENEFHSMSVYNGISMVKKNIFQLGMAKTVCEDWANLLMNEKVSISVGDEKGNEIIDDIFNKNRFWRNINRLCELAFALGTGAMVEYIKDNNVWIDFIRADMIFPLEWDSKGIHQCAFASVKKTDQAEVAFIQIHHKPDGKNYVVSNAIVGKKDDGFVEYEIPDSVQKDFYTESEVPLFQIIMPNIVNNADLDSPFGASVFANAIDVLKIIDLSFDAFQTEIETGRRMVFLSSDMFFPDKDGNLKNVIGEHEKVLRYVGGMEDELIHDYTPELRATQLKEMLQFQLNLLSEKCGMGTNRYEFGHTGLKTATEVISEDSDLYKSLKKHEIILEIALKEMLHALQLLSGKVGAPFDIEDEIIVFDDSIVEDKLTERKNYQAEVAAGLMTPEEYRQRIYGEDEKTAKRMLQTLIEDAEIIE